MEIWKKMLVGVFFLNTVYKYIREWYSISRLMYTGISTSRNNIQMHMNVHKIFTKITNTYHKVVIFMCN